MDPEPLHEARLDRIRLRARDGDRLAAFYERVLGLERISETADGPVLAPSTDPEPAFLLYLEEHPDAAPPASPSVGLYHFALLYPDRASLARAVRDVLDAGWERIDGAADHAVSEAFYLRDPEGNGVELYRDRARERWPEGDRGEVAMTTDRLDLDDLLADAAAVGEAGTPELGHIHLHVGEMEASRAFYQGVLALRVRQSGYPGALFLAAGAYHHHLGLNTWARGRRPPPGAAGLVAYGWRMPAERIRAAEARAREAGVEVGEAPNGPEGRALRDPDGIAVVLRPADPADGGP